MKLPDNIRLSPSTSAPIIHVDDDEMLLNLVEKFHRKSGISNPYLQFQDGDAFLSHLFQIDPNVEELPLFVMIDINMPGLDGFQILERLRGEERFNHIPLCSMLSSSTYEKDISRSIEVGADAYMVKPDKAKVYKTFFSEIASRIEEGMAAA